MRKAFVLAGLFLCVSSVFAAENQQTKIADGKKYNEEQYEKLLEQTGWTHPRSHNENQADSPRPAEHAPSASQPKSS